MKRGVLASVVAVVMFAALGMTYPNVDSSGASLGRWTSDLESAVEQSKSTGRPIVVCTVHECQHGCGAMLTRLSSDIASQSYLVCLNHDVGYPGYRSDFQTLMQRYANSSTFGQVALLYGGLRAGEIAVKYGSTHSLDAVTNALARMRGDYASVVACSSANAAVKTTEYSAILTTNKLAFTTSSPDAWQPSGESSNFETDCYSTGRSVRSGLVGDEEASWIRTTIVGPTKGSFRWMVSSEGDYDVFSFKIDNRTVKTISGDRGVNADSWSTLNFSVGPGQHTLTWIYEKDVSARDGLDGGWLADLRIGGERSHDGEDVQGDVIRGTDWLSIDGDSEIWCSLGEWFDHEVLFDFDSGSTLKTVSVTGLPAGLKYDSNSRTVSGSLTKRGIYWVTITAKNAGGYTHSLVQTWYVDVDDNGDFDYIGLDDYFDVGELENLCTGETVELCTLMKSVTGLPTGLKFTAGSKCTTGGLCTSCSGFISGMPTKAGKFKISFTDHQGRKAVKTVVVGSHGSALFSAESPKEWRGTARGTGVYDIGAKISLKASATSGNYFAGWYCDSSFEVPFDYGDKDYRNASQSVVFDWNMAQEQRSAYARFVSKAEDMYLEFVGDGSGSWNWEVDTESSQDSYWFEVASESLPKVTAKGLPSGVKLAFVDGYYTLQVTDVSKLKPGTSLVTLTAKNLSGVTAQQVVRVVVPNIRNSFFEGLDYGDAAYSFQAGESSACSADLWLFDCQPGAIVSATGVPPGLKFVYDKNWGSASLMGMATKAGVYTVTLTAKNGVWTEKATFTVEVKAFPTEAVGSYGGDIVYDLFEDESEDGIGYGIYNVGGSFSLAISKDGKVSVKYPANGKMVSLSGYPCYVTEEEIYVYLSDAKDNWCDLSVFPKNGLGTYQIEGAFGDSWSEWSALGQRNVAKTDPQMKKMVTSLSRIGKIQGVAYGGWISCPACVFGSGSPSLTFTVGLDGMVKASGRINGRSVSGSALLQVLQTEDDYLLYADFYDYKSAVGLLVYRAIFEWSWLRDGYGLFSESALYDGSYYEARGGTACKPVIYLYPEEEIVCGVKLTLNGKLTCTYPDYVRNGWLDFVAAPDGTLTFQDGRQFYCLYWEGQMNTSWDFSQGYCVRGSETATFLSDVLLRMGLSFREANEFIIYWLPQMQDNPYNVISFQGENYTKAAKLQIEPQPDSVLRVFMAWRPSSHSVAIPAPDIKPFERRGFTVVEWGGTKVGN